MRDADYARIAVQGVVERPRSPPALVASGSTVCKQESRMSEVFSPEAER